MNEKMLHRTVSVKAGPHAGRYGTVVSDKGRTVVVSGGSLSGQVEVDKQDVIVRFRVEKGAR